jgi:hypothetical protein
VIVFELAVERGSLRQKQEEEIERKEKDKTLTSSQFRIQSGFGDER